jgi:acid phosphatase
VNQPLTSWPSDYSKLPPVSFVIPNLQDDMHDGTIAQGDSWVRAHLSGFATWAAAHDSLLIVTWDEDDHSESNRIPTFIVGAGVQDGQVHSRTTTYTLLRYLEQRFGLPLLANAASAPALPALVPRK